MLKRMLGTVLFISILVVGARSVQADPLSAAQALLLDGNTAEAYTAFTNLLFATESDTGSDAGHLALEEAVRCLGALNRVKEVDELLATTVAWYAQDWRMLGAVAEQYGQIEKHGYIVSGSFERGHHRGGGRLVNAYERDRVQALRLWDRARQLAAAEGAAGESIATQLLSFAEQLRGHELWRLQILTDLSPDAELPDYDEGWWQTGNTRYAPTDAEGNPVFFGLPESYGAAANDGERVRALFAEAARLHPPLAEETLWRRADWAYQMFGEHTLQEFQWFFRSSPTDADTRDAAFALHTLGDDEALARLASGIKRFDLPEDWNYLELYRQLARIELDAAEADGGRYAEQSLSRLAEIYTNRRQYARAAGMWRLNIERHGDNADHPHKRNQLDQIVLPWGQFENTDAFVAGSEAAVTYRFRNGRHLGLKARPVAVHKLLEDVQRYLIDNPRELDHGKLQVGNIGHRLLREDGDAYLGEPVAEWTEELAPLPDHFDRFVTLQTPLSEAGAYLLTAELEDGNTSSVLIWIEDTVVTEKRLDEKNLFFVADARTGAPIADATVTFFGYWVEYHHNVRAPLTRRVDVQTRRFAERTDADGMVLLELDQEQRRYQWLVIATVRDPDAEPDEVAFSRLAHLGFTGIWHGRLQDPTYRQTTTFAMTDRPVYRPGDEVQFKLWVRDVRYDKPEDTSRHAGRSFTVVITDPRGEKQHEQTYKADEWGGLSGVLPLGEDAMLGQYQVRVLDVGRQASFRVEAYKSPEFEVTVDAPDRPLLLGDTIPVTVRADYLFGAPVTEGTVKIKITRSEHNTDFYPVGRWDWLYGNGYRWLGYAYDWLPGWRRWGCMPPRGWWWPMPSRPPELIAEVEQAIGPDGAVHIAVDTAAAKAMHADRDHRYTIQAEVTDPSRRTIVGGGSVVVARDPFRVFAHVDRGHYRAGQTVRASVYARTADGRPVAGAGSATLYRVTYAPDGTPQEQAVESWPFNMDDEGRSEWQLVAAQPGQYRLSATLRSGDNTREGGYVFSVIGEQADRARYRFAALELVPEKAEYAPGESVRLRVNTEQTGSTVLLFLRPVNGVYPMPEVLRIEGLSQEVAIPVTVGDMPNFFVEALTVRDGQVHTETREILVPPASRVLDVEVLPTQERYAPGEEAHVKLHVRDADGNPYQGSAVLTVYDRAVEYISGGSNVPEIRAHFWKWRRNHRPWGRNSLERWSGNLVQPGGRAMQALGIFGHLVAEMEDAMAKDGFSRRRAEPVVMRGLLGSRGVGEAMAMAAPAVAMDMVAEGVDVERQPAEAEGPAAVTVRTQFADTAHWHASIVTDTDGMAALTFPMPESLTSWRMKVWVMGHGTRVGEGTVDVVTSKNLLLRMQAPRFFVEKDVVTLSANIHNYFEDEQAVQAVLELDGEALELVGEEAKQLISVAPGGQVRVDWAVRAVREGEAVIRMKALGRKESDAMQLSYPVYVHGMLKTESFSGVVRPDADEATISLRVPRERRPEQSRLEVRYSPTLAGAMVDALPYLVHFPYGSTEQTLNRFLPTVIVQRILRESGVNLTDIREKRVNLHAQEIGDDRERARQWQRWKQEPVFDEAEVEQMVREGVNRLASMQNADGGWGWFSGFGERSFAHTTLVVVRGLLVARENGAAIVPGIVENGLAWLRRYQNEQLQRLRLPEDAPNRKRHADNLDAAVHGTLLKGGIRDDAMTDLLYRDRNQLSVYGKCLLGLSLHRTGRTDDLAMVMRNIEQFLVEDAENQTAWLNLGNSGYWWFWYGSEFEAHAYYLKLLAATAPESTRAAGLVKYLLNNRRYATYWNSTRDTALCVEAMADYLRASGEDRPDMTVEILFNGALQKSVRITPDTLFSFDNQFVLEGEAVKTGSHTLTVRRAGTGPVYFNAYLTNFTLEDPITAAGLEIKVQRDVYRLVRDDREVAVSGAHGQAVEHRRERYRREPLQSGSVVPSGELIEVELTLESKNDYEYIVVEDRKAAGFEAVDQRSGYVPNDMGAYVELRDERVVFFVRRLARGRHSVAYRLRAEVPGSYSALPASASAMYAPELRANSDEIKLGVEDQ